MKINKACLFLIILCISESIVAQRGFTPVNIKVNGTEVKLYNQSHALIIGISNYNNGWPALQGVKEDVIAVKESLEQNGFNTIVEENLTKEQMDKAFVNFISKYGQDNNNRLLFYFAGHGHTIKASYGEVLGYIVPVDAPNPNYDETGFRSKSMPMSRIEEYAKMIQSKHALFLFDACFSGSLFAMTRALPEIISYNTSKPVRQFITSGSEDETVPDESIFRQQFVSSLTTDNADANHDGYLTGTELGNFLQVNVVNYSHNNQHPQYGKIRNRFLDKGDFVFVLDKSKAYVITNNEISISEESLLPGSIKLTSYIDGTLYIDGQNKGSISSNKVYTLNNIPAGSHHLQIGDWEQTVEIKSNQTELLNAKSNKTKDLPDQLFDSRDGKYYKTVKIGNQVWMAENLAFNTGNGCCAYNNDPNNFAKYGYLYNWETAKYSCPSGWHLPAKTDIETLLKNYLGEGKVIFNEYEAEGKVAFNELILGGRSGFSALRGGCINDYGYFSDIDKYAFFWSSTAVDDIWIYILTIQWDYERAGIYSGTRKADIINGKDTGNSFSVRCIRAN